MLELFLQDIILNVETVYKKDVYCHIGNSANISKELTNLMQAGTTRFPLFAFMRPFKVIDKGDHYDVTIRRVAIATVTLENKTELEKIHTNFETYLRPLNEIFRTILAEDKRIICGVNGIEYTSEDMPFFNSNAEPMTSEQLDGIVIDNLNLKLNKAKINCN